MKMTLVLLLGASLSAAAQGTLIFANTGGGNDFPILMPNGEPAQPADNVFVDLYYGPTSTNVNTPLGLKVHLEGNGLFTSTAISNANPAPIPGVFPGDSIFVKVVAWQGGDSYAAATSLKGESPVVQVTRLGGGDIPSPNIPLGTGSFCLIPPGFPPSPTATIRREDNAVAICWVPWPAPCWPIHYVETKTNLATPTWTRVPIEPVLVNGFMVVTNPITASSQFFRLRHLYSW